MVIYLFGPDSYRRGEKLREVVSEYEKKHSRLTIERFDLEEEGAKENLAEFLASTSLFEPTKLAVVSGLETTDKKFGDSLKLCLEDKNTTLVVVADKKLGKDFAWLQESRHAQEFEHLESSPYLAWAKKEAEKRGAKISPETLRLLRETYAGDSWGLITELEKISLGGKFEGGLDIPEFFPLVQRIKGSGTLPQRLSALAHALDHEDPAAVFNVAASIASPEQKVKFADYDVAVKSGKLEYEEVLLDLVIGN